ncbi:MAG: DUF4279 domain-containing protein [Desulfobulbaceae bacterium]|nr:DUF4279 domain-containing protein [Desulfobulbaceae bacterium]
MNENSSELINIALLETNAPSLGTTEQILEEHRIAPCGGSIYIEPVSASHTLRVYFPLQKVRYSLVVVVDVEHGVVVASYTEAYVRAYLNIFSPSIHPGEISEMVGLQPTSVVMKGEPSNVNRPLGAKAEEYRWIYHPQENTPYSLEYKLLYLLAKLRPVAHNIANLPADMNSCLNICYEGYYNISIGGWHFSSEMLAQIAALKVEVDFDIYASKPETGNAEI